MDEEIRLYNVNNLCIVQGVFLVTIINCISIFVVHCTCVYVFLNAKLYNNCAVRDDDVI